MKNAITVCANTKKRNEIILEELEVLHTPDEQLIEVLSAFPVFPDLLEKRGDTQDFYDGILLHSRKAPPEYLLGINAERATDKKNLPKEEVTLLKYVNWEYKPIQRYDFPFGTLINLTDEIVKKRITSFNRHTGFYTRQYFGQLEILINYFAEDAGKTNRFKILHLFNNFSYPVNGITIVNRCDLQCLDSLACTVYHSYCNLAAVFDNGTTIKRCKTCNKVFFAVHGNQDYCYFENPDETLKGMSCKKAKLTRVTREESKRKTLRNKVQTLRQKYEVRNDPTTNWKIRFDNALDDKREELAHDPWMYTKLVEWVKEYDKNDAYKKQKEAVK